MYTIPQMSKMLEHMSMRKVSEDSGASLYSVRQIKNQDGNVSWRQAKKVSDYLQDIFEGDQEDG